MIYDAVVAGRTMRVEVRASTTEGRYTAVLSGREIEVDVRESGPHVMSLLVGARSHEVALDRVEGGYRVALDGVVLDVSLLEAARGTAAPRRAAGGPARVQAPMPGKIVRVLIGAGDEVTAGQGLVVMEAMKMENEIRAPRAGRVKETPVREGQAVETGALLVLLE
jgi:biotin carboxyl carrier protein